MGKQNGHDDDWEIGFQNVRPSQVFEKQRVALQVADNRINQIREQNRKGENNDGRARDVDDRQRQRKEEDCQQYARRTTVRKNHKSPQVAAM